MIFTLKSINALIYVVSASRSTYNVSLPHSKEINVSIFGNKSRLYISTYRQAFMLWPLPNTNQNQAKPF